MGRERSAAAIEKEKLARETAENIAFLLWVVEFTELITKKHGKLLESGNNGSPNGRIARECCNFHNFSFRLEMGQSMMGGNVLKVWYHPEGPYHKKKSALVLDAWWQFDTDNCDMLVFNPKEPWYGKLVAVMRQVEGAPAKVSPDRLTVKERRLRDDRERERQLDIQNKKGRLHLL